jgi:hypothetical protein
MIRMFLENERTGQKPVFLFACFYGLLKQPVPSWQVKS